MTTQQEKWYNRKIRNLVVTYSLLVISFFGLLVLGTVNVFSSTFVMGGIAFLGRHLLFCVIGLLGGIVVYTLDYQFLRRHLKWIIAGTVLLLIAVEFVGVEVNGAKRWINIVLFQFQPSEIAKLVAILCTASVMAAHIQARKSIEFFPLVGQYRDWPQRLVALVVPHTALWGPLVMAVLVLVQPDAGTAIIIMAIPVLMFFIQGAHFKRIIWHLVVGGSVFIAHLLSASYRMDRIRAWWNPDAYASNLGYQVKQSMIAIGSGGLTGQGLGEGVSKFRYLPEAHTDFAFAIFSQEWGFAGAVVVILAFFVIGYFGMVTAMNCKQPFGRLLALGLTLYFCVQGMINIGMVCDLLPVVGVPLPFISYGGTSLVVNLVAVGLLLNIAHTNIVAVWRERRAKEQAERSFSSPSGEV